MSRSTDRILFVTAALAVVGLLVAALSSGAMARYFIAAAIGRDQPPPPVVGWQRADQKIREVMPAEGNVVAHFSGTPADDPHVKEFAVMFMYRANYALWPRRMYVAPADGVIISADDVLASQPPENAPDVRQRIDFHLDHGSLQVQRRDVSSNK